MMLLGPQTNYIPYKSHVIVPFSRRSRAANGEEMYKKTSRAKLLFCLYKSVAVLTFSFPSPWSLLKLPIMLPPSLDCEQTPLHLHFLCVGTFFNFSPFEFIYAKLH